MGAHKKARPSPAEIANREANVFAAYLLMPEGMFESDIERGGGDLCDTEWLEKMARKYRVPVGAVAYRLMLAKG